MSIASAGCKCEDCRAFEARLAGISKTISAANPCAESALAPLVHKDIQAVEALLIGLLECRAEPGWDDTLWVGVPVVAVHQPDASAAGGQLVEPRQIGGDHLGLEDAAIEQVGRQAALLDRRADPPVVVIERQLRPA